MNKFKHSGTFGDILYGMPIVKYFKGGEYYLHLGQVDWIGQHYYNSPPAEYHQGRMNQKDYEFMKRFMEAQDYITAFKVLDPNTAEITHNLDRFRPYFVNHPANYVKTYALSWGIPAMTDPQVALELEQAPWFTVPEPRKISGKPIVINRSPRGFCAPGVRDRWIEWRDRKENEQSVFVGLESEHQAFEELVGCKLDHAKTNDLLEVAEVIAGAELFMGNQSMGLALAQGLGVTYQFEIRQDLPLDRNESYFPDSHPQGTFFR